MATPQDAPRAPQEAPREAKRALKEAQELPRGLRERFWSDFGAILDPPGPQKSPASAAVLSSKIKVFVIFGRRLKKRGQSLEKGALGDANIEPRAAPRGAKSAPRRPQEPPRAPQEPSRGGLGAAFLATCDPHGAQEAPRGLREAILTPPGVHFRTLRGTFWVPGSVRFSSPSELLVRLQLGPLIKRLTA